MSYVAHCAPTAPVSIPGVVIGPLSASGLFSALALLVVIAALVGLAVAFLMAGRDRPSSRRSTTGRVALVSAVTEHEWRGAPSTPTALPPPPTLSPSSSPAPSTAPAVLGPTPAPAPVVTHPDDPDFLLVSTEGPRASDELLTLPGLGASAPIAPIAASPVAARASVAVPSPPPAPAPVPPVEAPVPTRAAAPAPAEPPLRLEPAAPATATPPPRPLDRLAPEEPPAPPPPTDPSMYAVDRYALLRRIESLEERTDAHSRAWARSLRARLESGRP